MYFWKRKIATTRTLEVKVALFFGIFFLSYFDCCTSGFFNKSVKKKIFMTFKYINSICFQLHGDPVLPT